MSIDKSQFLYPKSRYHGQINPQNLVFNSNLQEFATQVNYLSSLQTNGKISPQVAYEKIASLWKQLENSKNQLGIND